MRRALETLCRAYWYPIYVYVRRKGYRPDEAQDLTQEFFAQIIAKERLRLADSPVIVGTNNMVTNSAIELQVNGLRGPWSEKPKQPKLTKPTD